MLTECEAWFYFQLAVFMSWFKWDMRETEKQRGYISAGCNMLGNISLGS